MFLSGRASTIQRSVFVQNATLRTDGTGRNWPLNCTGVWISGGKWLQVHPSSVSSNSLPTYLRSTCLGTAFPNPKYLGEIFHRSSLTSPRFSGKKFQVGLQKVNFQTHIASHSFVQSRKALHNILTVRCFVISKEVVANPLKRQLCISFSLIEVFTELFVLHQFPDLPSYKHTLLDLCVTHVPQIFESTACFIHTFHKGFHESHLCV